MPADSHSDASRDTVSLTYQELADRLGIDVQSARRRALRSRWPKVPGNDGRARVNVPATVLPAAGATTAATVAATSAAPAAPVPATSEALSHLLSRAAKAEGESATLREQVESERGRADRAEARAAQAEREREAAKVAAAAAEREAAVRREAEARERQAREAAERELAEWTAGGPLARALRALAFRRGRVP
jgi:pilus assembly protein FimV